MGKKEDKLSEVERQSLLFDFYGSLLTEGQNEVMALYHEDNLSLSEIAEQLGTTRQAVHYTLKKAEAALGEYEEKLSLIEQYQYRKKVLKRLGEIILNSDIPMADKAEAAILLEAISE